MSQLIRATRLSQMHVQLESNASRPMGLRMIHLGGPLDVIDMDHLMANLLTMTINFSEFRLRPFDLNFSNMQGETPSIGSFKRNIFFLIFRELQDLRRPDSLHFT